MGKQPKFKGAVRTNWRSSYDRRRSGPAGRNSLASVAVKSVVAAPFNARATTPTVVCAVKFVIVADGVIETMTVASTVRRRFEDCVKM